MVILEVYTPLIQDVSTRIITFTSQGPWAVCILSANGAISNATLRHPGVSGGAVTYEVCFSYLLQDPVA
jgi:hypothetical protein